MCRTPAGPTSGDAPWTTLPNRLVHAPRSRTIPTFALIDSPVIATVTGPGHEGGIRRRADTVDLRRIFGKDVRYTVPLFQRPYVWTMGENWAALWEDIRRTVEQFERAQESGETVPPHFLGAVVFDQTPYLSSNLETRQIIDGQQRLTTLQLFLYAARLSATALNHKKSVRLLSKFLENDKDLFDADSCPDHLYKVWPTNADGVSPARQRECSTAAAGRRCAGVTTSWPAGLVRRNANQA
ncbi:DUF262 domain-containing protein [Streptomyces atratus]|uniref:DUF262 domain-containing protein n=1 Tax=Streptomyces atratus TaxID=1893 RepID=UPI0022596013|nr:DUF262 domain-containing protein [Streptomyces atratus]MCX5340871.1 DUF262 domain-containing protein [Streptomyces atratus]